MLNCFPVTIEGGEVEYDGPGFSTWASYDLNGSGLITSDDEEDEYFDDEEDEY
jgi:hypothetical protein